MPTAVFPNFAREQRNWFVTIHHVGMGVTIMAAAATWVVTCLQPAWAQVKLEYKFPEGKKLMYRTTSRARQVLTFGGTNIESVKRDSIVWSRSFGKRREDSTLPIEERVVSLRAEYSLPPGIKLALDSKDAHVKIANRELGFLGDVFKLESEIAYTVILDARNKPSTIEGIEKLAAKAGKLKDPIAREEVQNELKAAKLRTKFEQAVRRLPDGPVHVGESWERSEFLEINGTTFTIHKRYEYVGTEKNGEKAIDKITWKVTEVKYDQDPDSKLPLKVGKSDLKVESSEGTILFERDGGHDVSASEKLRIKGNMTFSGAGVDQSGGFELTFDTNTQMQLPTK
jgi:hypothetical protein